MRRSAFVNYHPPPQHPLYQGDKNERSLKLAHLIQAPLCFQSAMHTLPTTTAPPLSPPPPITMHKQADNHDTASSQLYTYCRLAQNPMLAKHHHVEYVTAALCASKAKLCTQPHTIAHYCCFVDAMAKSVSIMPRMLNMRRCMLISASTRDRRALSCWVMRRDSPQTPPYISSTALATSRRRDW
eukprot:scpid59484/ scgid17786/ 